MTAAEIRAGRDIVAARAKFLGDTPSSARRILERAFTGGASPRQAIKAMCLTCSHFDRAEIADCPIVLCPLHCYRPFQTARKGPKNAPGDEFSGKSAAGGGQVRT